MPTRDWRRLPWKYGVERRRIAESRVRRVLVRATHQHCHVEFQGPAFLGPGFSLHMPHQGSLIVGPGVEFRRGFSCEIWGNGRVVIGAGTAFTYGCLIQCGTLIEIGERCMFAQATSIVDGNHSFRDHTRQVVEQGYDFRDIHIGNDVWTGAKCTIVANIGDRSVIGANSVVTNDIPQYSLAVGVPARVIEYFGPTKERRAGV